MKKVTLSTKIVIAFVLVTTFTLASLYLSFSSLLEQYTLRTEKEKVSLIAETVEPMIAMNAYLGLNDEINTLIKQISDRKHVLGGELVIHDKKLWGKQNNNKENSFYIDYPIKHPLSSTIIGNFQIIYSKEEFEKTASEMRKDVLYHLGAMSIVFIIFTLIIRKLLIPLSLIALKVKNYTLGEQLDFSDIRIEQETQAITDAFSLMVHNVREYTALLEQYKLSVDESSIVTKTNPDGTFNYVNDKFLEVSEYERNALIGSKCNFIMHPDEDPNITKEIWETLESKKIWKGVLKNMSKNGKTYYVNSTMVPLLDEYSNIIEFISIQHDITQVIEQSEKIQNQTTDEVTGLPNRVKLAEDINDKKSILFALFSLDNYEIIKNYYGYEASANTMKQLANMLNDLLLEKGFVIYRLSGGEFGLLANKKLDIDWFRKICQYAIEKTEHFQVEINDNLIDLRASVGFTSSRNNYLSYSGLALRHAIESKSSLIYYEDQENLIALHESNLLWTRKIKEALAENKITLFAQPLIDSKSMLTTKYECLVRLIDEDDNIISPFHFLEIAKKTKLYHNITQKVINLSFETFSQIPDKQFSINLSAEDILHKETMHYLEQKIIEYNIGSRVILEIVESEGIDSYDEVVDFINKMKSLGCTIAIDDFGTGYSNFSYLMKLKVDYIKIDGSLIKDIDHNKNSQIICSTILNFSKALGMSTVAEYVHSEDVLQYVKELGFDYLQGFHLGEPEPIQNLLALNTD